MPEENDTTHRKGPKGGVPHTPGRGHDTKSGPRKKKRFRKRAAQKRREKAEVARKLWKEWDELTEEQRKLLGPKGEPPADRRRFIDPRDEAEHLYHKLLYWLYERRQPARARAFADRLARALPPAAAGEGAIFPEECWSLICEARGDTAGAIRHRENEVRLIGRLHKISRHGPQREAILRLHGYEDLCDRLDLLAVLYHESGQLDRAVQTLRESQRLCRHHGLAFDGADLLRDYLEEKRNARGGSERPRARRAAKACARKSLAPAPSRSPRKRRPSPKKAS